MSVLGGHQRILDGVASFKIDPDSHLTANVLKSFAKSFGVWDHHINVPFAVIAVVGFMVVVKVLGLVKAMSIAVIGLKSV